MRAKTRLCAMRKKMTEPNFRKKVRYANSRGKVVPNVEMALVTTSAGSRNECGRRTDGRK